MLVPRSELTAVERERDEWRKRAEARLPIKTRKELVLLRSPRWARFVAGAWLVLLGVLAGGVAVPRADETPILREDYPACISAAREDSFEASRYRELVAALYACGIYES